MKIKDKAYVALEYRLTLDSGELVDQTPEGQQFAFVMGTGQILPGLEEHLMDLEAGSEAEVSLTPENGYGVSKKELILVIPRERFPENIDIKPGSKFQTESPEGPALMTVVSVADETVEVDFNHPLADKQLHFAVKVTDVREPTKEELDAAACGTMCDPQGEQGCGGGCGCH